MANSSVLKIGLVALSEHRQLLKPEQLLALYSQKWHMNVQIALVLADYLVKYSKQFDRASFIFDDEKSVMLPNGTVTGLNGLILRGEIDFSARFFVMREWKTELEDFAYPFKFDTHTFLTYKPQYIPQVFGILKTFSSSIWIAIISALMIMSLIYYVALRSRYSFDKICLHTFAVLLRQSAILAPFRSGEGILIYAWVIGAMFICLSYDSVFLSFLAFPPVNKIKDTSQLAAAVAKGEYHCVSANNEITGRMLEGSTLESLKIISQNLMNTKYNLKDFRVKTQRNIALVDYMQVIDIFKLNEHFLSEDRFLEFMAAIKIRKHFCCKEKINTFVHRLMASGIYFKFTSDCQFLLSLSRELNYVEEDYSKRKLTMIDVAPAFMFLITGYALAFLVFVVEKASNHREKKKYLKRNKHIEKKRMHKEDFVELALQKTAH